MNRFEYKILQRISKLHNNDGAVLLNLQVSGGMDSMILFHTVSQIINSPSFSLKDKFIVVVQHFNHKKRGEESDDDASFVTNACLKKGIPIFQSDFVPDADSGDFQNTARKWRKNEAVSLCETLKKELGCERYFIVTAHHGRDHVETLLQHILRGCSLHGLAGIQEFDENEIYFRPFFDVEYEELINYSNKKRIVFRVDGSNLHDDYERNYIRNHIIPHFTKLRPHYQKSFRKLSDNICEHINTFSNAHSTSSSTLTIVPDSKPSELLELLRVKEKRLITVLTQNSLGNILHEAHLLRISKKPSKEIKLSGGSIIRLRNRNHFDIEIEILSGIKP